MEKPIYTKYDLQVAFEQSRCNNHSFDEWYKFNYSKNEHRNSIECTIKDILIKTERKNKERTIK